MSNKLENKINKILANIGIPSHLSGNYYLKFIILKIINNENYLNINELYSITSKELNVKRYAIERSIRYAIKQAFKNIDIKVINKFFGNTINKSKKRPTSSEFVFSIANYIIFKSR